MLAKTSALDVNCEAYDADVAMLLKIYRAATIRPASVVQ